MSTRSDPIAAPSAPDRLVYSTGMLLDAQDFTAEQLYHRSRLARALSYLHGAGTIAGLRVVWEAGPEGASDRLLVRPGLALDRFGRLIEVTRSWCLRLKDWYDQRSADEVTAAFRENFRLTTADETQSPPVLTAQEITGIVADVFIRFVACERGLTPAFQRGPFDALDAVAASRVRDGSAIELVIRDDPNPQLPEDPWAAVPLGEDAEADSRAVRRAALDGWTEGSTWLATGQLSPLREHKLGQDFSAVFLARVVVPAARPAPGGRPERSAGPAAVDNYSRRFVASGPALASIAGL